MTAGVVNLISAKPTAKFEAMASADFGNSHNRPYEGMINASLVDVYHHLPTPNSRSKSVTVPSLGAFAGVSWRYADAKITMGYKTDYFFGAISAGDTVRWAVGDTSSGSGEGKRVHVLVKPFTANLKTNLVILTDRRSYHLELQSTDHVSMAAVSWSYPDDGLIADKGGETSTPVTPANIDSGVALANLNFRYAITGDSPPWRPLRAFDDGRKVYIEFPDRIDQGEAPPLFVVGPDGGSELVNYRVRDNYYIVDRLFGAAELRLGEDKQQIVRISRTDGTNSSRGLSLFGG